MALALCQLQPYLATCATKVLQCTEGKPDLDEQKPEEKKGAAKKKGGEKAPEKKVYDVELEQSVLFPRGGGQPSDVGDLVYKKGNIETKVFVASVFRNPEGKVIHRTETPLAEGTEVQVVVDWERRYDHMQQHSAQHLISAVADQICGAETLSWWLASNPEPCSIDFHKELTQAEQDQLLQTCNQHIRSGLSLGMHVFNSLEEAAQHPAFRSGKHPVPSNMQGPLRVIEIPGVDYNKCCGTHLKNTAEMQLIQFVKTEKLKGMFRLYFVAGGRSVTSALANLDVCKQLGNAMCTSTADLPSRVTKLQGEFKAVKRSLEKAQAELAELEAHKLVGLVEQGARFVSLHKTDSDLEYISTIANVLSAVPSFQGALALLTYSEGQSNKEGGFLVTGPADTVKIVGARVATALDGRGGGRPGRYQGKAAKLDQLSTLVSALQSEFPSSGVQAIGQPASGFSPSSLGFCSNLECVGRAVATSPRGPVCASCAC